MGHMPTPRDSKFEKILKEASPKMQFKIIRYVLQKQSFYEKNKTPGASLIYPDFSKDKNGNKITEGHELYELSQYMKKFYNKNK